MVCKSLISTCIFSFLCVKYFYDYELWEYDCVPKTLVVISILISYHNCWICFDILWRSEISLSKAPSQINEQSIFGIPQTSTITILGLTFQPNCKFSTHLKEKLGKANKCLYVIRCLRKEGCSQAEVDVLFNSLVLPNITYALSVHGASESELTIAQQFLDRCFKRSYISKKLVIGDLLKTQDHKICRKVSTILSHPLRAYFPETKITRYNLRNKSPVMPAIRTNRFKNTFFNRIVFKYNVAL